MTQSYEGIHKDLFYILISFKENSASLRDMYFKLFYEFIINNTFSNEYITELTNSNFLETIKNQTNDSNIINLINEVNTIVTNIDYLQKQTKECGHCQGQIDNAGMCMTCGFECEDSNSNIRIEEFHKNIYSYPFHQRINIHNPRKYCEKLLIQLQGRERVNISSENFNKI